MSTGHFLHSERGLAAELGVAQKDLRNLRSEELDHRVHWETVNGEVRYSDGGKALVLSALKIAPEASAPVQAPADVAPAVAPEPPQEIEASVDVPAAASEKIAEPVAAARPWSLPGNQPFKIIVPGLDAPPASAAGGQAAAARDAGVIEDLTCLKCYKPNHRILEAKTKAGEIVLVRVRDNRNLQPGMVMKCRYEEGRMWSLAQRLPRARGKW